MGLHPVTFSLLRWAPCTAPVKCAPGPRARALPPHPRASAVGCVRRRVTWGARHTGWGSGSPPRVAPVRHVGVSREGKCSVRGRSVRPSPATSPNRAPAAPSVKVSDTATNTTLFDLFLFILLIIFFVLFHFYILYIYFFIGIFLLFFFFNNSFFFIHYFNYITILYVTYIYFFLIFFYCFFLFIIFFYCYYYYFFLFSFLFFIQYNGGTYPALKHCGMHFTDTALYKRIFFFFFFIIIKINHDYN